MWCKSPCGGMATRFVTEPPPKERLPDASHMEQSRRAVERRWNRGRERRGQVHVGKMRQEPTRAGRTRCEVTLGKPLWRDETLAAQLLRPPFEILDGQRRREVTLAGRRRREA